MYTHNGTSNWVFLPPSHTRRLVVSVWLLPSVWVHFRILRVFSEPVNGSSYSFRYVQEQKNKSKWTLCACSFCFSFSIYISKWSKLHFSNLAYICEIIQDSGNSLSSAWYTTALRNRILTSTVDQLVGHYHGYFFSCSTIYHGFERLERLHLTTWNHSAEEIK